MVLTRLQEFNWPTRAGLTQRHSFIFSIRLMA
jgi:hypothetical protein